MSASHAAVQAAGQGHVFEWADELDEAKAAALTAQLDAIDVAAAVEAHEAALRAEAAGPAAAGPVSPFPRAPCDGDGTSAQVPPKYNHSPPGSRD